VLRNGQVLNVSVEVEGTSWEMKLTMLTVEFGLFRIPPREDGGKEFLIEEYTQALRGEWEAWVVPSLDNWLENL
jgi:hypothetical protein